MARNAQRSEVGQAVAAVGEHHREIANDPAHVVAATRASRALPACETSPSPSGVTSTVKRRPTCVTFKVILPSRSFELRQPEEFLLRRTVQRPRSSGPQLL